MGLTRRRLLRTSAVASLTMVVAGCQGDGGDGNGEDGATPTENGDGSTTVGMTASQFEPRNLEVDGGTDVEWTNESSIAHTVTAASENWSHDVEIAAGESTTYTFESDGVYDVYCRFHGSPDLSGMSMKVGVGDATIASPLGGGGGDGGTPAGGGGY